MSTIRTSGPSALVMITALITLGEYYFVSPQISEASKLIGTWVVIILAFTMIMATARAYVYHVREVQKRTTKTWYLSVYLMVLVAVLFSIGMYETPNGPEYVWWTSWVTNIAYEATYVTTAMWWISATFRTFRARSIYTLGAIVALVLFTYGAVLPIGESVPGLSASATWVFDVLVTGSFRGILIGSGIGVIFYGIRTILGRERRIFGA